MQSNQETKHRLAQTPDQEEIKRLRGELDACHRAYLVTVDRLGQLKQELIELQTNLQQQEPRLNEVRNFLHRMGELDMANGKQHPSAS